MKNGRGRGNQSRFLLQKGRKRREGTDSERIEREKEEDAWIEASRPDPAQKEEIYKNIALQMHMEANNGNPPTIVRVIEEDCENQLPDLFPGEEERNLRLELERKGKNDSNSQIRMAQEILKQRELERRSPELTKWDSQATSQRTRRNSEETVTVGGRWSSTYVDSEMIGGEANLPVARCQKSNISMRSIDGLLIADYTSSDCVPGRDFAGLEIVMEDPQPVLMGLDRSNAEARIDGDESKTEGADDPAGSKEVLDGNSRAAEERRSTTECEGIHLLEGSGRSTCLRSGAPSFFPSPADKLEEDSVHGDQVLDGRKPGGSNATRKGKLSLVSGQALTAFGWKAKSILVLPLLLTGC